MSRGPGVSNDADVVVVADVTLIERISVPRALPKVATPLNLRRSQDVRGIAVAGNHLQTPSIQGALVSRRRTARQVRGRRRADG